MKTLTMSAVAMVIAFGALFEGESMEVAEWPPDSEEIAPAPADGLELVMMVRQTAERHGISPRLLEAIAQVESNFDPKAVSRDGAIGLLQVVPETAGREVYRLRGMPGHPDTASLFQAEYNADIAAEYVAWLHRYFGQQASPEVIVAAYNAGPGRVRQCLADGDRWQSCLPTETRKYLSRVDTVVGGLRWQT